MSRQGRRRDGMCHSCLSVASTLPLRRLSGLSINRLAVRELRRVDDGVNQIQQVRSDGGWVQQGRRDMYLTD